MDFCSASFYENQNESHFMCNCKASGLGPTSMTLECSEVNNAKPKWEEWSFLFKHTVYWAVVHNYLIFFPACPTGADLHSSVFPLFCLDGPCPLYFLNRKNCGYNTKLRMTELTLKVCSIDRRLRNSESEFSFLKICQYLVHFQCHGQQSKSISYLYSL